jgi:hypothetical protein
LVILSPKYLHTMLRKFFAGGIFLLSAFGLNAQYVGIGTTDPQFPLDVNGAIRISEFRLGNTATAGHVLTTDGTGRGTWQAVPTANQPWTVLPGGSITFNPASPQVGIGVAAPAHPLHIQRSFSAALLRLDNTALNLPVSIQFRSTWGSVNPPSSTNSNYYLGLDGTNFFITAENTRFVTIRGLNAPNDFASGAAFGINTQNPLAPLHVAGSRQSNNASNIRYFNAATTGLTQTASWTGPVTGYFEGNVISTISFIAAANAVFSDARIKRIEGQSDAMHDLEKLNRLEVTNYRYKDTWKYGDERQTKVIAQQVKEVLPEAVKTIKNVVPDILQLVDVSPEGNAGNITINLKNKIDVKAGDRIKCFAEDGQELAMTVQTVAGNSLTLSGEINSSKLFLYGKEVEDFHVVDYDAISMLNVSATQALTKKLEMAEKEIEELKALIQQFIGKALSE